MKWLYSKKTFNSTINGLITVRRFFGQFSVYVNGEMESSPYTDSMWKKATQKIGPHARIKKVLILGLAGGSCVPKILKKFPNAHITAIEWDSVMGEVYKDIRPKEAARTEIIIGDVSTVLPTLQKQFDLIVFDLYQGNIIADTIIDPAALDHITRLLARNGYYLVNYWLGGKHAPKLRKYFTEQVSWRFRSNSFGLYRPQLPHGYTRYRSNPRFIEREQAIAPKGYTITYSDNRMVLQKDLGLLTVRKLLGNEEPTVSMSLKPTLTIWHPTSIIEKPKGWRKSLLGSGTKSYGFVHITSHEYYWKEWSSHAQRHRNKWISQEAKDWSISEIPETEFYAAFSKARLGLGVPSIMIQVLKYKIRMHGDRVKLIGARNKDTNTIEAGLAVLDIPEALSSAHIAAFHLPLARNGAVGTALIDAWFKKSIKKNIIYLDFGIIRAQGETKSWQGYSDFKNQFITHTVFSPKPFWKFTYKKTSLADK